MHVEVENVNFLFCLFLEILFYHVHISAVRSQIHFVPHVTLLFLGVHVGVTQNACCFVSCQKPLNAVSTSPLWHLLSRTSGPGSLILVLCPHVWIFQELAPPLFICRCYFYLAVFCENDAPCSVPRAISWVCCDQFRGSRTVISIFLGPIFPLMLLKSFWQPHHTDDSYLAECQLKPLNLFLTGCCQGSSLPPCPFFSRFSGPKWRTFN